MLGRWSSIGVCLAGVLGVSLLAGAAQVAAAVGDPNLDQLIIKKPVAGWSALPDSSLQTIVDTQQQALGSQAPVSAAAEGVGHGHDAIVIALVASSLLAQSPRTQVRAAVISFCAVSGNTPTGLTAIRDIPNSAEAHCTASNGSGRRLSLTTISAVQSNVMMFIFGNGLPIRRFEAIAEKQFRAIPKDGVQLPTGT